MKGQLYMIPNTMGESPIEYNLPVDVIDIIKSLKYYVVENIRSARRFLKKVDKEIDIEELTFFVLDKHTKPNDIPSFLRPLHDWEKHGNVVRGGVSGSC